MPVKKRLLRALAIVAGAALLLAGGVVALSHIAWGRSLKASVYEIMLRRRFATTLTAETEIERLEKKRVTEEPRYALSDRLRADYCIEESEHAGMQVFTLNAEADAPIVLYLHGGAYINAFNAYQWRFMDRLARETGCRVVAPAYHLAPWTDYRQAYEDLSGLYRDLRAGQPDARVMLMGDSAGGGLALGLAEYLVKEGDPLPERLILFSPWVDVSMDNPDIADYVAVEPILHLDLVTVHGQYWAGDADTHFWMVSPLFGDMAGLPPVTIYCGTREILYPDILLAGEKLEAAGVDVSLNVYRGMNHDFPLMPLREADRAFAEIKALVQP